MRTAIASIVADAEARSTTAGRCIRGTCEKDDEPATRFRTLYLGVPGSSLRSTASRSGASSSYGGTMSRTWSTRSKRRRTSPTRTPSAASGWARRESGWCCSRLAPSQANLERLSELIAANERDERCELMWGSPGTILAGRELGLDVTASIEWLAAGATRTACGRSSCTVGAPAFSAPHMASRAACSRSAMSPTSRKRSVALPSRKTGSSTGRRLRG